jgi:uncharacterized protein (UPF0332 family)
VTPETAVFLAQADWALDEAVRIAAVGIARVAAREAYMAAFHAAQAAIFERAGRVVKTHRGVHGTFAQIAKDDPGLGPELGHFLAASYKYKYVADYRADSDIVATESEEAIAGARQLLDRVKAALGP